jgi:hypothetical protein
MNPMNSTKAKSPRSVSLGVTVTDKTVFLTATGLKVGRGKVTEVGRLLGQISKGEARRVRKALHRHGHARRAATLRLQS